MQTIGAYEAKTHFSELLERVSKGERITISSHGVPVAVLQPIETGRKMTVAEAIKGLQEFPRVKLPEGLSIKDMIEEGRD